MGGVQPAVQCAGIKVRARHRTAPSGLFRQLPVLLMLKLGNFTSRSRSHTRKKLQEPNVDYSTEIEI
jgi:hypothetical protein